MPGEEDKTVVIESTEEGGDEEGEVRATSDAVVSRSGRIGDRVNVDSAGMSPDLILGILKTAARMFVPSEELPSSTLQQLAMEAIASTDGNYGIREVVKWTQSYEFPQELVDSDLRLLRSSALDFTKMVEMRLERLEQGDYLCVGSSSSG